MAKGFELFERAFLPGVADHPSAAACMPSPSGASAAYAAAALARVAAKGGGPLLAVVPGLPEADVLLSDLEEIAGEAGVRVLDFPPPLEDDAGSSAARLKVSSALGAYSLRPYPFVVVAPYAALSHPVASSSAVSGKVVRLSTAEPQAVSFAALQERLREAGYAREAEVTAAGVYSVRGGVLDVWSPGEDRPVRAEFFGDDLESLREFDPATQTSVGRIECAELTPVRVGGRGRLLWELMPEASFAFAIDHDAYDVGAALASHAPARIFYAGEPPPKGVPSAPFRVSPLPGFAGSEGRRSLDAALVDRMKQTLDRHLAAAEKRGATVVRVDGLSAGFEMEGLVVVAKADLVPCARRSRRRAAAHEAVSGERLTEAANLEPGDLVVHLDYGIGKFVGSTEVEVGGIRSEVFTLEYADGATLHVPVSHAHLLSRYVGVKGERVKLHRLDGKRWVREKAEAQRAVADLAASLLETQARRQVVPGFACDLAVEGMAEFEAAFPYEETEDQAKAIEAVKADLASTKPMDRLICGDAGYGKTEVAMRAAFVAAMNGRQVALLAPTTVLAEQHYETFLARFADTPVRIEAISRFQSPQARDETRARLESGATDVVIGTHALLTEKTRFRDLGLIIIDEEQRFGVRHKEFLKGLRATADVLTMSATPIPRTLYLSMTGARDLSVLRTPPRERVAVETRIERDSDELVRSAIEKEMARGGQTYFLHNRVTTLPNVLRRLQSLVPSARIEVAHGQMPGTMLSAKMQRFSRGEMDVLLCTSIVESGLDVPRANTIIVSRADRFGLAELYQIRGRVGRSSRQGHAYFLVREEGLLDAEARERLAALKKHSGLGAGFNVAMRDLEIRGAGNLLGREQSGHIAAVGFSLYCQLLQRTISRLKGEKAPEIVDVTVNLDFLDLSPGSGDPEATAALPYEYVEEESQRMEFHKRLAEAADSGAVRKLRAELEDRYGKLPPAAQRLVKLAEFRVRCAARKVSRLDVKGARAIFYREGSRDPALVGRVSGSDPDRKLNCLFRLLDSMSGGRDGARPSQLD